MGDGSTVLTLLMALRRGDLVIENEFEKTPLIRTPSATTVALN